MNIKAMIFDMDGVVMDSMHMWRHLAADYLRSQGKVPDPNINKRLQAMSLGEGAKVLGKEYEIEKDPTQIAAEIVAQITEFYFKEVGLKKHAKEGLSKLKEAGMVMCMATSTDRPLAEAALLRCDVMQYFEFLLTSAEIGGGKDRPDIFLEAAKLLGESPEDIMVIEDSPVAIEVSKNAGFRTCGVRDDNNAGMLEELYEHADACITYLTELLDVI